MNTLISVAGMALAAIGSMMFNPLFWVIVGITALIYKKNSKMEYAMLGYMEPLWQQVLGSLLAGLMAGLLGSGISVLLGITLEEYVPGKETFTSGIIYIWVVALLLSLLNQRYLCFSYAGGIVALSNLIIGYPKINALGILSLVGILHLAESLLILMDGHTNAVPGFFKTKNGNITGGYFMNRVWPLPVLIFFIAFISREIGSSVSMPDWWPVIKQAWLPENSENIMYILQPIPVVLGYGDFAITKSPALRCRETSMKLGLYSITLIGICVLASKISVFAYAAALFAPIGHELLILHGQKSEEEGVYFFSKPDKGLKVLSCIKNFPGSKMNIKPGDIVLSINNIAIDSEEQLNEALANYPTYIWLDIERTDGSKETLEFNDYAKGIGNLGIIFISEKPNMYFEIKKESKFLNKIKKFFKR